MRNVYYTTPEHTVSNNDAVAFIYGDDRREAVRLKYFTEGYAEDYGLNIVSFAVICPYIVPNDLKKVLTLLNSKNPIQAIFSDYRAIPVLGSERYHPKKFPEDMEPAPERIQFLMMWALRNLESYHFMDESIEPPENAVRYIESMKALKESGYLTMGTFRLHMFDPYVQYPSKLVGNNGRSDARGRILYGYSWNTDRMRYDIVENEAETIREIFKLRKLGKSFYAITNRLNASARYRTRENKRFHIPTIQDIVDREYIYRGLDPEHPEYPALLGDDTYLSLMDNYEGLFGDDD